MPQVNSVDPPEQGQLVQVRNRFFLVQDIQPFVDYATHTPVSKVVLECIDDDRLGEHVEMIWELEVQKRVMSEIGFPEPTSWDTLSRLDAFLHAIDWSCGSLLENIPLRAPFYGAIELEEYQLEPVVRAILMPRVNLLLADDVGLGKTIEAGLVIQELLARQRIRRIMIITPASLMVQWQEEMTDKFNLDFKIIDRDEIFKLRKEYGLRVNPWNSYPRLITSMDFIKRDQILNSFKDSLKAESRAKGLHDWDLLIVDEAHNLAPAGKREYIRDSDRTLLGRSIVNDFEHRLFLTATPHNGFTYSFTALLEMLDPLRFSRGPIFDPTQRDTIMIRRMKEQVVEELGSKKFQKRNVDKIEVSLPLDETDPDRQLLSHFELYRNSRLARTSPKDRFPVRFAMTLLKKRLLSCPFAFSKSLDVHLNHITRPGEAATEEKEADEVLFKSLHRKASDDWEDDVEKHSYEEQALQESSKFFGEVTREEDQCLSILWDISSQLKGVSDKKARDLLKWIKTYLLDGSKWNDERLVLFTEYKDTLEYLKGILEHLDDGGRIIELYGGMPRQKREDIKAAFQAPPSEHPMRILLATDAASEGLNLQNHCRYLIHYEIPWNPNKMEQRNGRIDRHGQKREVTCYHFVYSNHEDSEYLQVIIDKMKTQRADIGAIGALIEREVEEQMVGGKGRIEKHSRKLKIAKDEAREELQLRERIKDIERSVKQAKIDLDLRPEVLKLVVEEGLQLALNNTDLRLQEHRLVQDEVGYLLPEIPSAWHDVRKALIVDGKRKILIFDQTYLKDRKNVALIHLNHPLMQRVMGVFRSRVWEETDTGQTSLRRVSYKVVTNDISSDPALIGIGRLVTTNHQGQKLHEALTYVGGSFSERDIVELESDELALLLKSPGSHPHIPRWLADQLRGWFVTHQQILKRALERQQSEHEKTLHSELAQKGKSEASDVKKLIKDRIQEIQKRLTEIEKEKQQLELEFKDEEEQFDEDLRWLQNRLTQLGSELTDRPAQIQNRYRVKQSRVYPLALLYVLPESMVAAHG